MGGLQKNKDRRTDLDVDLQSLQLWEPLQSLLTSDNSSQELKTAVLWIIGTALQNNPAAQDDVCTRLFQWFLGLADIGSI